MLEEIGILALLELPRIGPKTVMRLIEADISVSDYSSFVSCVTKELPSRMKYSPPTPADGINNSSVLSHVERSPRGDIGGTCISSSLSLGGKRNACFISRRTVFFNTPDAQAKQSRRPIVRSLFIFYATAALMRWHRFYFFMPLSSLFTQPLPFLYRPPVKLFTLVLHDRAFHAGDSIKGMVDCRHVLAQICRPC
jgi:hypothetical protein